MERPMTIKDLLVHVDQSPATATRLDAALELGERFGAHVTALHLIAEPFMRNMAGYHLPADVLKEHLRHAEAEAEQVFAQAREAADHRGISLETRAESGSLDRLPALFARNARNTDLVIIGEPNAEAGGADETLLVEAAFMDTGRPALVIPQAGAVKLPPERVLIAWDGSREAARAVHDSMPLLRLAEEVVILIVDASKLGPRFGQQPGAGIVAHLGRHKVACRINQVQSGGSAITDLILAEAKSAGADLIVMGGYGHSRLRELMLGGVTRHMIERMTLPVLLAH
jgi:nucleotide-binding universal stress UspA family protein